MAEKPSVPSRAALTLSRASRVTAKIATTNAPAPTSARASRMAAMTASANSGIATIAAGSTCGSQWAKKGGSGTPRFTPAAFARRP